MRLSDHVLVPPHASHHTDATSTLRDVMSQKIPKGFENFFPKDKKGTKKDGQNKVRVHHLRCEESRASHALLSRVRRFARVPCNAYRSGMISISTQRFKQSGSSQVRFALVVLCCQCGRSAGSPAKQTPLYTP